MTEQDVIDFVSALPGVAVQTAAAGDGSPEIAWGDSFFFVGVDRRFPFATIVTKDYPDFDTESQLDRPGAFRVNVNAGKRAYQELFGHLPAVHAEHHGEYDYAAADRLVPHPAYGQQAWVSVVNPGPATAERLRELLVVAHAEAARRR